VNRFASPAETLLIGVGIPDCSEIGIACNRVSIAVEAGMIWRESISNYLAAWRAQYRSRMFRDSLQRHSGTIFIVFDRQIAKGHDADNAIVVI
jgi:hypothetical protein